MSSMTKREMWYPRTTEIQKLSPASPRRFNALVADGAKAPHSREALNFLSRAE